MFKHLSLAESELKIVGPEEGKADAPMTLTGYGSTFGGEPDSYGDIIAEGAYSETLKHWNSGKAGPLQIYWNHDPDQVIGKWTGLVEDRKGLLATGELTIGHSKAADVAASLKHGAVSGLSIGYRPKRSKRVGVHVLLEEIELRELSIVSRPANANARIIALKAGECLRTVRELEAFLRDCGLSRREAEAIAQGGFKALAGAPRDEDRDEGNDAGQRRDDGPSVGEIENAVLAGLRGMRLSLSGR